MCVRACARTQPPGLDGLYTPNELEKGEASGPQREALKRLGLKRGGGWDGAILNGNFVALDLEFWFRPEASCVCQGRLWLCAHTLHRCVCMGVA